jgi:hypothetical protein
MIIQHSSDDGEPSMTSRDRGRLAALTLAGFGAAAAGTAFCIVQIYRTAQLPEGDGTGMQWVILTPLTMLFLFIVVPAFATGMRGLRLMRMPPEARRSSAGDFERPDGASGQDEAARSTQHAFEQAGASGGAGSEWQALPGKGWLVALGLLALYLLAPFVLAPIFGLFMDE